MKNILSRRDFLKLGGAAAVGLGLGIDFPPGQQEPYFIALGRVAYQSVSVFDAPRLDARTVDYRFRDELLHVYSKITPVAGPAYNPLWFKVFRGYVHSAFVQLVDISINDYVDVIPAGGMLTELTVPYSQPYDYSRTQHWQPKEDFRLYYGSTHWVTDVLEGPGRIPWYEITDELWDGFKYYVPAGHLRPIPAAELTPISPDVPADQKRIEVSLTWQRLTAYEGDQIVLRTAVSTGIPGSGTVNGYPTTTPVGTHYIQSKMPSKHMGTSRLTDTLGDRALPGVPWTMFFAEGGYAIHGAYWHNNFGWPISRGCINMRNHEAKWLFRWVMPQWSADVSNEADWEVRGRGTQVTVVE